MQKKKKNLRLKTNMLLAWSTVSYCCVGAVRLCDHEKGAFQRGKEGKVRALMNFECAGDDLLEHLKDL